MTVYYPTFQPVVNPLTLVTQVRELPLAGEVLKRMGNRVEPDEIVARTLVPARGQRFAVARSLGISAQRLSAAVLLQDGEEVSAGRVVAQVGRLRQRVWRAPIDGTLSMDEAAEGYLVIVPPTQNYELRAHFKGFVLAIEPYRSVSIQTPAALMQGAFGFGGEQHGVLRAVATDPSDELLPDMLDERAALSIVIGAGPVGEAALERAVALRVRGLIVGSITEQALRTFLGLREDADWAVGAHGWSFPPQSAGRMPALTLIVTEGLGERPMSMPAFQLLTSCDGNEAAIDGTTWLHGPEMRRPQVIIPLTRVDPADIVEGPEEESLAVGSEVRLLSDDMLGLVGTIVSLPRGTRPLDCGARYRVAEVRLHDGSVVVVPWGNMEGIRTDKKRPAR